MRLVSGRSAVRIPLTGFTLTSQNAPRGAPRTGKFDSNAMMDDRLPLPEQP
jgi:hypothetical protein